MSTDAIVYRGVIRGKTIELERSPELPEGQGVTVAIQPLAAGDGIRESAGGWAEAGPQLDEWLSQLDKSRRSGRSVSSP